ncbi:hypothetical protein ALC57_02565 [Trachymyrmex cornetzi]|uniref:RNase H type-1 domain-containing protein n=1 Tax=Trachymyrmex cornetzi TaxID=471704 RepID=A0A151JNG3_9HYME|nr:hypothetical protein ALC57_02565 [Trachymyrmex cornetzi]
MTFSNNERGTSQLCSPTIEQQFTPRVEQAKFLGIILDSKMKGTHLKYLIQKGKTVINIISALTAVWWGSHSQCLLSVYRSVFRGSIEYACAVFAWNNSRIFLKLERLQYKAIRTALGYRQSTPINVMLCEARELPLKLRFSLLNEIFVLKCLSKKNHPVISNLERLEQASCTYNRKADAIKKSLTFKQYIINKYVRKTMHRSYSLPAFERDYSAFIGRKKFQNFFVERTGSRSDQEIVQEFLDRLGDLNGATTLTMYTDGSRITEDGCAGASLFSPELAGSFLYKLYTNTSVFTAEAWAILQSLTLALDEGFSKIIIFSDSRSVLEAIGSHKLKRLKYVRKIDDCVLLGTGKDYTLILEEKNCFGSAISACKRYILFTKHVDNTKDKNGKNFRKNCVKLRFIDFFKFLSASLDKLASYLDKDKLKIVRSEFCKLSAEDFDLLTRKGVFPYEYVDCVEKLQDTRLSPRELFFSSLTGLNFDQLNTNFRTRAKNDFEKNLYKLMNNAVFDETMENVHHHVDVKLITKCDGQYGSEAMIAKPNFHSRSVFAENLITVELRKLEMKFNKPIYVGMCILDISKVCLYEFHYGYMSPMFQDECKIMYTDTDSLIYREDIYGTMKGDIARFDTSDYPADNA